jgi:hypothetical protein
VIRPGFPVVPHARSLLHVLSCGLNHEKMKKTTITLIALILFIMLAGRAEATEIFGDGFEGGNFGAWDTVITSNGTATVQSTTKYLGAYAKEVALTATSDAYGEVQKDLGTGYTTLYFRAYVRFSATPTSGNYLALTPAIRDVTNQYDLAKIKLHNNAGTMRWALEYVTGSGTSNAYSTTPTISINTWYFIEVGVVVSNTAGTSKAWIAAAPGNSVSESSPTISVTGLDNDNYGNAQILVLGLWNVPSSALAVTAQYDCIVVSDSFIGLDANNTIKGTGSTSATAGLNVTNSSDTSILYVRNDGNVGFSNTSPGSTLDVKGTLRLSGSVSGYVGLAPDANAGSTTYTLPSSPGTNGGFLSTNGSGTLSCLPPPGHDLVLTHTAGSVAPVTKTITYRTVTTDLSGDSHTWITQNLGADAQSSAWNTTNEFSAGWYWQFNRKQGYKIDAGAATPSWTITSIDENSDWVASEDPCTLLIGASWRLPTYTEWSNVITNGGWNNYYDPYSSCLRISSAGMIDSASGYMWGIDTDGMYWSSTQGSNTTGWYLDFYDWGPYCGMSDYSKALGNTVRCLTRNDLVVTHTSGDIAPVTKTITYQTVTTDLSGATHTWITQNLGADNQGVVVSDTTSSAAGWYWQFNRKQGYDNNSITCIPPWPNNHPITENSNWLTAQDPCTLLLGASWRLPTATELSNVLTNGSWADGDDAYSSVLKLHYSGYIDYADGSLDLVGTASAFYGSTQYDNNDGQYMRTASWFVDVDHGPKAYACPVRCLK